MMYSGIDLEDSELKRLLINTTQCQRRFGSKREDNMPNTSIVDSSPNKIHPTFTFHHRIGRMGSVTGDVIDLTNDREDIEIIEHIEKSDIQESQIKQKSTDGNLNSQPLQKQNSNCSGKGNNPHENSANNCKGLTRGNNSMVSLPPEVLKSIPPDNKSAPQNLPTTSEQRDRAKIAQVLYKCFLCEIHLSTVYQLDNHLKKHGDNTRLATSFSRRCKHCNRKFATKYCDTHEKDHDNYEFTIKENAIAKCKKCKVHFHSFKVYRKHMDGHNSGADVTQKWKKKCHYPQCGLYFIEQDYKNHREWFHKTLNLKKADMFVIESLEDIQKRKRVNNRKGEPLVTLYKCVACNVCFSSLARCSMHLQRHKAYASEEILNCEICNLRFYYMTIHKHIKKYHIAQKYNRTNFHVKELTPTSDIDSLIGQDGNSSMILTSSNTSLNSDSEHQNDSYTPTVPRIKSNNNNTKSVDGPNYSRIKEGSRDRAREENQEKSNEKSTSPINTLNNALNETMPNYSNRIVVGEPKQETDSNPMPTIQSVTSNNNDFQSESPSHRIIQDSVEGAREKEENQEESDETSTSFSDNDLSDNEANWCNRITVGSRVPSQDLKQETDSHPMPTIQGVTSNNNDFLSGNDSSPSHRIIQGSWENASENEENQEESDKTSTSSSDNDQSDNEANWYNRIIVGSRVPSQDLEQDTDSHPTPNIQSVTSKNDFQSEIVPSCSKSSLSVDQLDTSNDDNADNVNETNLSNKLVIGSKTSPCESTADFQTQSSSSCNTAKEFSFVDSEQRSFTLSTSIYANKRIIKMTIKKNGRVNETWYICAKCYSWVEIKHIKSFDDHVCIETKNTYKSCQYWKYEAAAKTLFTQLQNDSYQVDIESLKFLISNLADDKQINKAMRHRCNSKPDMKLTLSKNTDVYKCYFCDVHRVTLHGLFRHVRDYHENNQESDVASKSCGVCGLKFSRRQCSTHEKAHATTNFNVRVNAVARCRKCSVCFHDFPNLRKHIERCQTRNPADVTRKECSFCKLSFPCGQILQHKIWFHQRLDVKVKDMDIIEIPPFPATWKHKALTSNIKRRKMSQRPKRNHGDWSNSSDSDDSLESDEGDAYDSY